MMLLCPRLLKSFICPVDTFMLQPQPLWDWVTSLTHIPCLLRRASSRLRLESGGSVLPRCNPLTHTGITHPDVSSPQAMALLFWDSSYPWATDELRSKTRSLTLPSYTLPCLSWSWINSSLWQRQRSMTTLQDKIIWEVCRVKDCGKATGQGLSPSPLQHIQAAEVERTK